MAKKCKHDDNMIIWAEDRSRYECDICGTKKCKCGVELREDERYSLCGRCEDKYEQARFIASGYM